MSLIDIEKNDVDISQLFAYKKNIALLVPGDEEREVTFFQRVVGDAEVGQARTAALRTSAEMRAKLRDTKWKDRIIYIPKLTKLKKEDIIDLVLSLSIQELTVQAINKIEVKLPIELSGEATLEDQERYQEEVDAYPDKFQEAVATSLDNSLKGYRRDLNKVTKDELIKNYEAVMINQHASEKFTETYQELVTYLGTYNSKDYVERSFKSLEHFQNAPSMLKQTLIAHYTELEVSASTLKKSPGVTQ